MVYVTRSKPSTITVGIPGARRSTITARGPQKKLASPIAKTKNRGAIIPKTPISARDVHAHHTKDGKQHHVFEHDGRDRHHEWYNDSSENEDQPGSIRGAAKELDRDDPASTDASFDHNGSQPLDSAGSSQKSLAHRAAARLSALISKAAPSSTTTRDTDVSKDIHAEQGSQKRHLNDRDQSEIERDGFGLHPTPLDISEGTSRDERSRSKAHKAPRFTSGGSNKAVQSSSSAKGTGEESHSESSSRRWLRMDETSNSAIACRYQDSNATTTTETVVTARSSASTRQQAQDEARTRYIAQKSQVDRQKARDAIFSLDGDVVQLQRLLLEKDAALRAAETQATELQETTIRSESLSREICELEVTICSLQDNLKSTSKTLKKTQNERQKEQEKGIELQKALQEKIAKLDARLKDKEHVRMQSLALQKSLDEANAQRVGLVAQIHRLSELLKSREADLQGARSTIDSLERSNHAHSEETLRLVRELSALKRAAADREDELKEFRQKISALEGNQEKAQDLELQIQSLREQISEREVCIKVLERANRSLRHRNARSDDLTEEVRVLRAHIKDSEFHLSQALTSVTELSGYKARAVQLEEELRDLQDQIDVQEKHLTYLEDALESHEGCAMEIQGLQGYAKTLEDEVHQKQAEIQGLQRTNAGLEKEVACIPALQSEMRTLLHEMKSRDQLAATAKEKADHDLNDISSTASALKIESENLRQRLLDKTRELKEAQRDLKESESEKAKNMDLTVEVTRLEKMFAEKERKIVDLERIVDGMKDRARRADILQSELVELRKETDHAKNMADQSARDLHAASSTASQLVVQRESLREQLLLKEKELALANQNIENLQMRSREMDELLIKVVSLDESSRMHLDRAEKAEKLSRGMQGDIDAMEVRLADLQDQLGKKESGLQAALDKANSSHQAALQRLEETQGAATELKRRLKDADKCAKHQIAQSDKELRSLQGELKVWEDHEVGWIAKVTDLTVDLEKSIGVIHRKDKLIGDMEHKLGEQSKELTRMNETLLQARDDIRSSRKRQLSEIEDRVHETTREHNREKSQLKTAVSKLESHLHHLEKRLRFDHNHEVKEQELAERIRELVMWKQTSEHQTNEWETTVEHLEREKEQRVITILHYERQIRSLQEKLGNAELWRERALSQAEKLTAMIMTLDRELNVLKSALAQHDAHDGEISKRGQALGAQIKSLESARDELHRELRTKDGQIAALGERLREEVGSYSVRLEDARRDISIKDNKIEALGKRIAEQNRAQVVLEKKVAQDGQTLSLLENTLDSLRASLATQMDRYKKLDIRYKATLVAQADQDRQLNQLERKLVQVAANDAEKHKQLQSRAHHLEAALDKALKKIGNYQLEIHNLTRSYHDALAQVESATAQMSKMVPQEQANHDACAARVQSSEREVARLSLRISDLKATVNRMSKERDDRARVWVDEEIGYKDQLIKMAKQQQVIEAQLRDADHERLGREQDRMRAEKNKRRLEDTVESLKQASRQLQKEFLVLEAHLRREMTTNSDLTGLLAKLRHSIQRDSAQELESLDHLEKELKSRGSIVEETIRFTRSRMDSGAFLETQEMSLKSSA
ncbi:hypothetical protein BGZ70_000140 [Mortierella alpina]|uniref:Uncharacterized protein n=1 Tax=Mortierella alpina TaxID=64518 RepID=A0A9P6IYF0_MORAP|nr:hypothetical protein BGZ70_000140 [Mortierella alpina]